ncbi:UDP-N-acetylmuramate--L-alanine ligase [Candidatus Kaiserbacteria bacterium]|nr:UDP-N-acetylmuramate--L-alanine ligase [Candidatus Kaiserbacteria bacterium]
MTPQRIHMVGIGGVGMSALAQLYAGQGARVSGSDRERSPTTEMLEKNGISVFIGQTAGNVPDAIDLLVYSDAVPAENPERARAHELGIPQLNYFEALGKVAEGKRVVAVAGTHGKTTTTAMLGKILTDAGADPTVVVGSIVSEWGSNFKGGGSDLFVVEACEYRRHFLVFRPQVLVITNIEWDHTDYFKTPEDLQTAFIEVRAQAKIVIAAEEYKKESAPELLMPGEFNKDNARAAKAAVKALELGIADAAMDASLASFRGTWRRFEHKGTLPGGAQLYDDYAHHPSAIIKTIEAAQQKFAGKKIVVFFHPHLYSRTRDLFGGFAQALAAADQAYILPVYAAREPYDPTATHEALAAAVNAVGGHAKGVEGFAETTALLETLGPDTVAFTMGAGDVYKAGEEALV